MEKYAPTVNESLSFRPHPTNPSVLFDEYDRAYYIEVGADGIHYLKQLKEIV